MKIISTGIYEDKYVISNLYMNRYVNMLYLIIILPDEGAFLRKRTQRTLTRIYARKTASGPSDWDGTADIEREQTRSRACSGGLHESSSRWGPVGYVRRFKGGHKSVLAFFTAGALKVAPLRQCWVGWSNYGRHFFWGLQQLKLQSLLCQPAGN